MVSVIIQDPGCATRLLGDLGSHLASLGLLGSIVSEWVTECAMQRASYLSVVDSGSR